MSLVMTPQEKKVIDTIRALSMDGVQKAKSGHPGTAMALAPIAYLLYNEVMNYDPARPDWLNRDRFVLSIGHASILLYSILHLAGVSEKGVPAVTMDDLKSFRQLGSRCAGHPEYGLVPGIEMTTGPLGAGLATSVGMAMAGRWLGQRYNRENAEVTQMGGEMTVDRIEKTKKGYVIAGEHLGELVVVTVRKTGGAKEGDIIYVENGRVTVLEEKTRRRREEILKLQKELSD